MLYPVELRALWNHPRRTAYRSSASDLQTPGCRHHVQHSTEPPESRARLQDSRCVVGVEGFEPPTPCSQSRCATRLRYTPRKCCVQTRALIAATVAHGTDQRRERQSRAFAVERLACTAERAPKHPFQTSGAPGEIRTPDHQVRSLVLYPTELRARRTESMPSVLAIVNRRLAICCPIVRGHESRFSTPRSVADPNAVDGKAAALKRRRGLAAPCLSSWRRERDSNPR